MTTLALQCAATADDAYQQGTSVFTNFSTHQYGRFSNADKHIGMSYPSVSGLGGETISGATQTWYAGSTDSATGPGGDLYMEDTATPGQFTTASSDITNRTTTAASIDASLATLGTWTLDTDSTIDGFEAVVQEIADSYDPSRVNVLCFKTPLGSGTAAQRTFKSYEGDNANAPRLDIDMGGGGGGGPVSNFLASEIESGFEVGVVFGVA